MKTNYKKIYKALNEKGIIDNLLTKYSKKENFNLVKTDIIFGIECAVEFINSDSFKNMKYWNEKPTEIKYQIAIEIEKEYAKIIIDKCEKEKEMFQYLLEV